MNHGVASEELRKYQAIQDLRHAIARMAIRYGSARVLTNAAVYRGGEAKYDRARRAETRRLAVIDRLTAALVRLSSGADCAATES